MGNPGFTPTTTAAAAPSTFEDGPYAFKEGAQLFLIFRSSNAGGEVALQELPALKDAYMSLFPEFKGDTHDHNMLALFTNRAAVVGIEQARDEFITLKPVSDEINKLAGGSMHDGSCSCRG